MSTRRNVGFYASNAKADVVPLIRDNNNERRARIAEKIANAEALHASAMQRLENALRAIDAANARIAVLKESLRAILPPSRRRLPKAMRRPGKV